MSENFPGVFAALREILRKHVEGMVVQVDKPTEFTVAAQGTLPHKKPLAFGQVVVKKTAVMYHLVPLYFNPKLQASVPAELLKRKQGKTCFNFSKIDPDLFSMLDELTRLGRLSWKQAGFLEEGVISQERLNDALRSSGEDPDRIAKIRKEKGQAAARKRAETLKKKKASLR